MSLWSVAAPQGPKASRQTLTGDGHGVRDLLLKLRPFLTGGATVLKFRPHHGAVAQLVAHLVRNEGVRGSSPLSSTDITAGQRPSPDPGRGPLSGLGPKYKQQGIAVAQSVRAGRLLSLSAGRAPDAFGEVALVNSGEGQHSRDGSRLCSEHAHQ